MNTPPLHTSVSKKWGLSAPLMMAVLSVGIGCLLGVLLLSQRDAFAALRTCDAVYVDKNGRLVSVFLLTQTMWIGSDLIVPYDSGILRVPVSDPACAQVVFSHETILDVAAVGDDLFAAVWTPDSHLMIYSALDNRLLWDLPTSLTAARLARFSHDGSRLAIVQAVSIPGGLLGSPDVQAEIWDLHIGEKIDIVDIVGTTTDIEFFEANTKIALLVGSSLWTRDITAKSERRLFPDGFFLDMALDPSGTRIAAPTSTNGVQIVDLASGDIVAALDVNALITRYSPDGRFVAALDSSSGVSVWDVEQSAEVMYGKSQVSPFNQVVFRDDNRWVAVVDFQDLERWEFWNVETGERAEKVID